MIVLPPRRRRPQREESTASMDRYALGFAIFGALTFAGALLTLCAVVTVAALMVRSEMRWGQMLGALTALPVALPASPLPLPVVESPLPPPVAAEEPPVTPTDTPPPIVAPSELPTATPPPEEPPFTDSVEDAPPAMSDGGVYQAAYGPRIDDMLQSVNGLNALLANPQLGDGLWREQINARTDELRQISNELSGAAPPFEISAQHYDLVNTVTQCLGALFTVEESINFEDWENFQRGAADFGACSPNILNLGSQILNWP